MLSSCLGFRDLFSARKVVESTTGNTYHVILMKRNNKGESGISDSLAGNSTEWTNGAMAPCAVELLDG